MKWRSRDWKNKFIGLALTLATLALGSVASASSGGAGNGQLLVQVGGQWVPIETALNHDSRVYRGLTQLPTGQPGSEAAPFNTTYGPSLEKWITLVEQVSPGQGKLFREAANRTDFVYLNQEIVFANKDYPEFPVEYKKFRKAALFYEGKVYVSIPNMEVISPLLGLSKEENQGVVMLHEVINVLYADTISTVTRIALGQAIENIRIKNWSPARYLAETAIEGWDFWKLPEVDPRRKQEVILELIALGRAKQMGTGEADHLAIDQGVALRATQSSILEIIHSDADLQFTVKLCLRMVELGVPYDIARVDGTFQEYVVVPMTAQYITLPVLRELFKRNQATDLNALLQSLYKELPTLRSELAKSEFVRIREVISDLVQEVITSPDYSFLMPELGGRLPADLIPKKFKEDTHAFWKLVSLLNTFGEFSRMYSQLKDVKVTEMSGHFGEARSLFGDRNIGEWTAYSACVGGLENKRAERAADCRVVLQQAGEIREKVVQALQTLSGCSINSATFKSFLGSGPDGNGDGFDWSYGDNKGSYTVMVIEGQYFPEFQVGDVLQFTYKNWRDRSEVSFLRGPSKSRYKKGQKFPSSVVFHSHQRSQPGMVFLQGCS